MVFESLPFGLAEDDPYDVYNIILLGKFSFPSYITAPIISDLVCKLLEPDLSIRLTKLEDILQHEFFNTLSNSEFNKIENLLVKAPISPDITREVYRRQIPLFKVVDFEKGEIRNNIKDIWVHW